MIKKRLIKKGLGKKNPQIIVSQGDYRQYHPHEVVVLLPK